MKWRRRLRVSKGGRARCVTAPEAAQQGLARPTSSTAARARAAALALRGCLLSQVPYDPLRARDVTLPERQEVGDYAEPHRPLRHIPTPY